MTLILFLSYKIIADHTSYSYRRIQELHLISCALFIKILWPKKLYFSKCQMRDKKAI